MSDRETPTPEDDSLADAYQRMRMLARQRIAQTGYDSLQATELVNEAWLRLADRDRLVEDRSQLLWLAARAMRDIVVERARRRGSLKRGGDWTRVNWESALRVAGDHPEQLLLLDQALTRLEQESPDHARVVDLMFFAGLTGEEAARALDVSASTVDRWWKLARAWLHRQLSAA